MSSYRQSLLEQAEDIALNQYDQSMFELALLMQSGAEIEKTHIYTFLRDWLNFKKATKERRGQHTGSVIELLATLTIDTANGKLSQNLRAEVNSAIERLKPRDNQEGVASTTSYAIYLALPTVLRRVIAKTLDDSHWLDSFTPLTHAALVKGLALFDT